MKIRKGKIVKLDRNEFRAGNFVYKDEGNYIKVYDINQTFTHRILAASSIGIILKDVLSAGNPNQFLEAYATTLHLFSSTVPVQLHKDTHGEDYDFMTNIINECLACLEKAKKHYGNGKELSKEEDDAVLEEVKQTQEAIEQVKKEVGNEAE